LGIPNSAVRTSNIIEYENSGYQRFNECHHLQLTDEVNNFLKVPFAGDSYDALGPYTLDVQSSVELGVLVSELMADNYDGTKPTDSYLLQSDVFEEKMLQHVDMSLDHLIPRLDTGLSVPVFIRELFELKALLRNAVAIVTKLPKHVIKLMKKPAKEISGDYLSAIFGWIPLVRDLSSIITKIITLEDIIDKYIEGAGKRRTLHYRKALHPETFQDADYFDAVYLGLVEANYGDYNPSEMLEAGLDGLHLKLGVWKQTVIKDLKFQATLDYTYELPLASGLASVLASARTRAGLDVFGINLSPSDLWEIVPLSFVYDWFFDIGSALEEYDLVNFPTNVVIHDYAYSYSYKREDKALAVQDSSSSLSVEEASFNMPYGLDSVWYDNNFSFGSVYCSLPQLSPQGAVHLRAYHRWAGLPVTLRSKWPDLTLPGGRKLTTGLALLGSRYG
jgi:hypothetical protein